MPKSNIQSNHSAIPYYTTLNRTPAYNTDVLVYTIPYSYTLTASPLVVVSSASSEDDWRFFCLLISIATYNVSHYTFYFENKQQLEGLKRVDIVVNAKVKLLHVLWTQKSEEISFNNETSALSSFVSNISMRKQFCSMRRHQLLNKLTVEYNRTVM